MNISGMRQIDYVMGGILCFLLDIVERFIRIFRKRAMPGEPSRIVVTKYLGMGSILLLTPALKALKKKHPNCKILLLTFSGNSAFAESVHLFDEVLSIRTTSLAALALDTLKGLVTIRKWHPDYLLDFEFFARFSIIVSYLSGARCRVGYYMPQIWRGDLLDIPVHFNPYRHVCEIFAAQVKVLGVDVDDFVPVPPAVTDAAVDSVRKTLAASGCSEGEALIAVNVNASDLSLERRWPKESFAKLIDRFSAEAGVRIVMVGSVSEKRYVESVLEAVQPDSAARCVNLAGMQSLEEFIALISICRLCITNDSGPLHIAASLGVRTVSFFGPESPQLYGPVGRDHITFYSGLYCSPCLSVYNAKRAMCNGDNICMKSITSDQVIRELFGDK